MTPFEILGISGYASPSDIKRRFRELAWEHHPDRGGDAEKFAELKSAMERAITIAENAKCEVCVGTGHMWLRNGPHQMPIRCQRCGGTGKVHYD